MKVKIIILCCLLAIMKQATAQSYESKQLLLDWSKLAQMKAISKDMKEGFEVVSKDYTTIRDILQGNFICQ